MNNHDEPLSVINYDQALENAGGEQAIFRAVSDSAMQEIPVLFRQFTKAVQGQQQREAERLAHTIKGAARVIAAERTIAIAERIELAASSGDFTVCHEMIPSLASVIDELRSELNS
ncbi:Hpt domain-containing protein [bacterium]|nr:Hpt domain-containing protein [Rubripirellula sp.]MDB4338976.1 Hpt domain-containing protein [Rubripirellula sp.]MDB4809669.1 Hpt domain-containing protein [bacterium]